MYVVSTLSSKWSLIFSSFSVFHYCHFISSFSHLILSFKLHNVHSYLWFLLLFPRGMYPLVLYSIVDICSSLYSNLFIIDLISNIYILENAYHIFFLGLGCFIQNDLLFYFSSFIFNFVHFTFKWLNNIPLWKYTTFLSSLFWWGPSKLFPMSGFCK